MSNFKAVDAKLTDLGEWDGPFFGPATERLQDIYSQRCIWSNHLISKVSMEVQGGHVGAVVSPTTSDGYTWLGGRVFVIKDHGMIAVLFPWAQDWKKTNGTQTDRHIAVYTQGEVDEGDVNELVGEFADRMLLYLRELAILGLE